MGIGYIFENVAYISDCNGISQNDLHKLRGLNYFIVDCLKFKNHPTHFNLEEALYVHRQLRPKKTILTNLNNEIDYTNVKKILPKIKIVGLDISQYAIDNAPKEIKSNFFIRKLESPMRLFSRF